VSPNPDELVTEVANLRNVSAEQLERALRPMISPDGRLAANPTSNTLTISGRASKVQRVIRISRRIDKDEGRHLDVIPLQTVSSYAWSTSSAREQRSG
jgi:general secretion pathway protein D